MFYRFNFIEERTLLKVMVYGTANLQNMRSRLTLLANDHRWKSEYKLLVDYSGVTVIEKPESFGDTLRELLQEIPVDYLKIDGAFIRKMELSDVEYTMVSSINHLAHIMGIATIAESVENALQLAMLRDLGVDYAQGFFVAMPQSLASILA